MLLRKWGTLGVLLGAAAFAGCDDVGMDDVQDQREDVIEAEQELREEEAELNETEREMRDEGAGPALSDPAITAPVIPPVNDPEPADGLDLQEEPTLAPLGGGTEESAPVEDAPNEGDPDAGIEAAADSDSAETVNDESGSVDEEAASESPEPAAPQ